ncbi:uncharacterized protein BDV14DRAFT_207163 [Aspergillus stella-maris]|uniref:uncharacterized protein n=1 Tax=Aspergillus stella-maris TaxID=1810926 RepID=UPI003CCCC415
MDSQDSSPLCELPPELLLEIRQYLDVSTLCSLRVTCKFLYACTLHQFGKTYLKTIQSDLSLSSLQRLEGLTRNPRLCPYVHSLDITGGNSDILGIGLEWERPALGLPLSTPQKSIQRLRDIISRLEKCQSFHLHKRNWVPSTSPLNPFDVITIILRTLSFLFKPSTSMCLGGPGQGTENMSRVDKALLQDPRLITAHSTLEKLTFRQAVDTPDTVDFMMRIIQDAPLLQLLSIDADCADASYILMSRLYSNQRVRALKLRDLRLKGIRAGSSEALTNFIASFKYSLTSISLAGIHLTSGSTPSILRALAKFPPTLTQFSTLPTGGWRYSSTSSPVHIVIDPVRGITIPFSIDLLCPRVGIFRLTYSGPRKDIALNALADGAPFLPGKG